MTSAAAALARLRDGDRRFVANESTASPLLTPSQRIALTNGQEPCAIVLGCSDSRVPAELVFDQGFGDLFVIRVAGNNAPSQVGSVESRQRDSAPARRGDGTFAVRGGDGSSRRAPGRQTNHGTCARSSIVCGRRSKRWCRVVDRSVDALISVRCAPTCALRSITFDMALRCSKA